MIKINVLRSLGVQKAIDGFHKARRTMSFLERNPHLGHMVNCAICGNRHFSSKICTPVYATHDKEGDPYFEDGSPLIINPDPTGNAIDFKRAFYGAAAFAKKRFRPHRHPRENVIWQITKQLSEESVYFGSMEQPDITKQFRTAKAIVDRRENAYARMRQRMQDTSRRINAGLAKPGERP